MYRFLIFAPFINYYIGKGTSFKHCIHAVGDTDAELPVVIQEAKTLFWHALDTLKVGICQTHDRKYG